MITVQSVTAAAGSTNDTLNVTLTNTGTSAVTVGGFAFEITAGDGVTFTSVDTSTTPAYIFAGHSAFGPDISNQPPNLPGTIAGGRGQLRHRPAGHQPGVAGATVGLGDVHFNVSSSATGPISISLAGFPMTNISDAAGHDITPSVGTTFSAGRSRSPRPVPEPSSLAMTAIALALGLAHRRRALRLGR